jgi:hypothetical protein
MIAPLKVLRKRSVNMEKTEGHGRLEIQSDLNVPHYLRNDFQYFGEVFRICNQTNPLANGSKLDQMVMVKISMRQICSQGACPPIEMA